jgi:hypothetical protein
MSTTFKFDNDERVVEVPQTLPLPANESNIVLDGQSYFVRFASLIVNGTSGDTSLYVHLRT